MYSNQTNEENWQNKTTESILGNNIMIRKSAQSD